jgi:hypothetical protein
VNTASAICLEKYFSTLRAMMLKKCDFLNLNLSSFRSPILMGVPLDVIG